MTNPHQPPPAPQQRPGRPAPPPHKTMSGAAIFAWVCAITIPAGVLMVALVLFLDGVPSGLPTAAPSTAGPTTTSVPSTSAGSPAPTSTAAAAAAEPTPRGPATSFGPGTYLAGRDFVAGTYRSAGPEEGESFCYWARLSNASGNADAIIANDLPQGPAEVTINAGEYFKSNSCQTWTRVA